MITKYCLFITLICLFSFNSVYSYKDYYIDRVTGEELGSDGSKTNNLRVIDIREWNYVIEEKGGPRSISGIQELHKNSYVVTFDENQIQKEVQRIADDTMKEGLENQVFIVLNVNNGKVSAVRDWIPELKTNKEIIISTYSVGRNSAPRVGEGLMLLGQLHGHPKEIQENKRNVRSVSGFDIEVAKELGVTIFAVDAFSSFDVFESRKSKKGSKSLHIHSVGKDGKTKNFIGRTFGKKGVNTFNFSNYFNLILRREYRVRIL
ncbi:hypothetical protein SAMN04487910_0825 [Aquimarina amphilecti]|uniref:Uncharacterized protein n=1 Tax=Aquimarina amphilecti TaxID=1038014 RepID=A0A1H7I2Y4_AQUAM|nr:hypothetical protein [Aquimarina amphilecti]SEK56212.1 hypothetical protein SAMN04487910_0825 [Aquimarina amphilecti]